MNTSKHLLSLLLGIGMPMVTYANDDPDSPACENNSQNPCYDCGELIGFVDEESTCPDTGSVLHIGTFSYQLWAEDYKFPNTSASGCGDCGAAKQIGIGGLPALDLTRMHSFRVSTRFDSSFGNRGGFKSYDKSIEFLSGDKKTIRYFDFSEEDYTYPLAFNTGKGGWAPSGIVTDKSFFCLYLYDVAGLPITTAADRDNASTGIVLHHDGTTEHYEVGHLDTVKYEGYGRLTSLMDRNGNAITIEHEEAHRLPTEVMANTLEVGNYMRKKSIEDAYGRKVDITTDLVSNRYVITKLTLPNGEEIDYSYGNLQSLGNPALNKVEYQDGSESLWSAQKDATTGRIEYSIYEPHADAGKRLKTVTATSGTGLDSNGNLISVVANFTRKVTNGANEFTFDSRLGSDGFSYIYRGGNKVVKFDIGNSATNGNFGFNSASYITDPLASGENFPAGDTTTWQTETATQKENNKRRLLTAQTDSFGRQAQISRNSVTNYINASQYPDNSADTKTLNQYSQPLTNTDRLGRITTNTYDALGNLLTKTEATGTADETTTTYLYNSLGQVIEQRDALYDPNFPELHNTQYTYDANGYLIEKTESADVAGGTRPVTTYAYDTPGRLISITDPLGRVVSFDYDVHSRLVKTTYNDTSFEEVTYGATGSGKENLVVSSIDRNGITTTYDYDLADRKIETKIAAGLPEESVELCTYLVATDKKQTCTINGEKMEYLFDYRNRVVGTSTQATVDTTLTTTTEYDVLDRRRSTTDAYGRTTFYLYDQNDRVIKTVSETYPGALAAPAITPSASQISNAFTYTLTDKDGNTLSTTGTHKVTYTCARDLFLENLTRSNNLNAGYLISENVYDAEGQRLISIDPNGNTSWSEYDTLGRITLTIAAVGTPEEIRSETDYDDNSNVIETRSPRHFAENISAIDTFAYNGRNLRSSHTTATGSTIEATQSWTYYLDGRNATHTDFRGNVATTLWHTCCGRLQASVQRDGTSASFNNTDYAGNTTHTAVVQSFDANTVDYHNPTDADTLAETTTRFDGRGRPTFSTQWLTPLGTVVDEARANLGNGVIPIAGLDGVPSTDGLTTSYTYDEDLTDGVGIDATYSLQIAQLVLRMGNTPFGSGSNGYAMAVTNPAGETSVQIQDGAGRTILSINPEGHITTMHYDALVDSSTLTSPSLDLTLTGELLTTTVTDANDNSNTRYTDAAGRTIISEDAASNLNVVGYDNNSNVILTRDPNGLGQNCTYDALNRDTSCADLQEQSETVTRSKTYNTASQVVSSTNAEGHITTSIFDERNRLTSTTDPNNITVAYDYDANNNLTSLTDGNNNTRQWIYDARNLKIQKINPGAGDTLAYTYDALGRLDKKTDQADDTCTMVYDLAGRMIEKIYKIDDTTLESTDTFSYDAASRLVSTHKGRYNVTTSHSYALDSMPTSESFTIDGANYTIARSYDLANRPVSHTFADGHSQNWSYDSRNLVTNLTYDGEQVLSQIHDAGYRLSSQTLGNGLARSITYARLDNLRTRDHVTDNSTTVDSLDLSYTYNVDKQVTAETTAGSFLDDSSFTASYDPGDRLTSWTRPDLVATGSRETEAWAYDNAGNQTTVTRNNTAQTRSYNSDNELTNVDSDATTLDVKGNLTQDADNNDYTYDLDNRISQFDMDNGDTIELAYDALGRRVYRKNGSDEQTYLWWGDQETSEHENSAGEPVIQNDLWSHPTALNQITARAVEGDKSDIEYYHKNYLDHVYAVSNDNGNLIEHYRYTAFGEPEIYTPTGAKLAASAIDNTVLWNSRRYDADTNLYYYKYRHYKADIGRWLSRDPIEEDGGINLYAFVGNDVLNKWDILGKCHALAVADCKLTCALGGSTYVGCQLLSWHAWICSCKKVCKPVTRSKGRQKKKKKKSCKACLPGVGTMGWLRTDNEGDPHFNKSKYLKNYTDVPSGSVSTPHMHVSIVNQLPYPSCKCRWNKLNIVIPGNNRAGMPNANIPPKGGGKAN